MSVLYNMERVHQPVLLKEVIQYLNIQSGSMFVDATLNGGGHVTGILEQYPDVKIIGIEFDPDIFAKFQLDPVAERIIATNDSYVHIQDICQRHQFRPSAILFDLGVSSHHYEMTRGFTFRYDQPLDMRFNPHLQTMTASDIVNGYGYEELEEILMTYGEEAFADRIAKAIVGARQIRPIHTTSQLVEVVNHAVPAWYRHRKIHPATKTFQAIRMEVNSELDAIRTGITKAIQALEPQGRIAVISFHGLEDKTVREVIKEHVTAGVISWVTKDTIKPTWAEVQKNPRARSAKMKIIQKL